MYFLKLSIQWMTYMETSEKQSYQRKCSQILLLGNINWWRGERSYSAVRDWNKWRGSGRGLFMYMKGRLNTSCVRNMMLCPLIFQHWMNWHFLYVSKYSSQYQSSLPRCQKLAQCVSCHLSLLPASHLVCVHSNIQLYSQFLGHFWLIYIADTTKYVIWDESKCQWWCEM